VSQSPKDILDKLEAEEDAVDIIPTGMPSLDRSTGIGGVPRGCITHITGKTYSGKSVMGIHVASETRKAGGVVMFADLDRSMDLRYMRAIGLNPKDITFVRPCNTKGILGLVRFATSWEVDMLVVDSFTALQEIPNLDHTLFEKMSSMVSGSKTALVIVNRIYSGAKIAYGDLIDQISHISMFLTPRETIVDNGVIIGHDTDVTLLRNRFRPLPKKPISLRLIYGTGFDIVDSRIDVMLQDGEIQRKGSWYYYRDQNYQGREELREALRNTSGNLLTPTKN